MSMRTLFATSLFLTVACGLQLIADESIVRSFRDNRPAFDRTVELFASQASLGRIEPWNDEGEQVDGSLPAGYHTAIAGLRSAGVLYVFRRSGEPNNIVFVMSAAGAVSSSATKGICYSPRPLVSSQNDGMSSIYTSIGEHWYIFEERK